MKTLELVKEEEEAEERKKAEIAAKQKSVKIQKKIGIVDADGKGADDKWIDLWK